MFIYLVTNKINGKQYVGQTIRDISKRIAGHINDKYIIGNALRKYGLQSFDISIIDSAGTIDVLLEKEKYWIKYYNCIRPNGYNITSGGEGTLGLKHTVETKRKISEANKGNQYNVGRKLSDEQKMKISETQRGHIGWNKGKHHSAETRNKISTSLRKTMESPEVRNKLSQSHKGNKNALGFKHSLETRKKVSEAQFKNWKIRKSGRLNE